MYIVSKIDYRIYKRFDKLLYFASLILLFLVMVPGLRWEGGGAARWIYIKSLGMTFQPSEIAKVALVVFFASYLTDNRENLGKMWDGFFKPILFYLLPIILVLVIVQSHLSASILIIAVVSIMMLMAGSKLRNFITFGSLGAAGGLGALYVMATVFHKGEYRIGRLTSFLNPWADAQDSGWQVIQGLYAIGSRWIIWRRSWK